MKSLKFRIAAKTDIGLVRDNNEDNLQASADLRQEQMRWVNNEVCSLGAKGALLVVADGMGGMNAGEVASALAIETVKERFKPENLTENVTSSRFAIEKFMNDTIVAADKRIKDESKEHPENRGMGTTIVIGWLIEDRLYISWCGDSRAYVYNPTGGLRQITKDHSYVQELIDKGAITKDEAFDYPESNVITRCLSDSTTKANPESLLNPYIIQENDIILLCTDGLSGMLRDIDMEEIIRQEEKDLDVCVDKLIESACNAGGDDNISICACQILQKEVTRNPQDTLEPEMRMCEPEVKSQPTNDDISPKQGIQKKWVIFSIAVVGLLAFGSGYWFSKTPQHAIDQNEISANTDRDTLEDASNRQTLLVSVPQDDVTNEESDHAEQENTKITKPKEASGQARHQASSNTGTRNATSASTQAVTTSTDENSSDTLTLIKGQETNPSSKLE